MTSALATPLATPVDLRGNRNASDDEVAARFHPDYREALRRLLRGRQVFRGLPFTLAGATARNRWLLLDRPFRIDLRRHGQASHVVIAHFCDSWRDASGRRPNDAPVGWVEPVGQVLARYTLELADGRIIERPIRRRFEVNEGIIGWGMGAFAAVPHVVDQTLDWRGPMPAQSVTRYAEAGLAGLLGVMPGTWGPAQTGVADSFPSPTGEIALWLHEIAIEGGPARPSALRLEPLLADAPGGLVVIAAVTLFRGTASPLALEPRQTFRIRRPGRGRRPGADPVVAVDLGQVIRVRPTPPQIDGARWLAEEVPGWGTARSAGPNDGTIDVDLARTPDARVLVDGATGGSTISPLPLPTRRVEIEVVDATTGEPLAARVHFRAADGRYLPPLGHRDEINPGLNEDTGADLLMGSTPYAYVPGRFSIDLPAGEVHVEAVHGFGHRPLRRTIDATETAGRLRFSLERGPTFRSGDWVAADTHVHFISPTTALLQARAEGIQIVNLLATQWGDHHTSVTDLPATVLADPSGQHLVCLGSENRQNLLGHVGLLGASRAVLPMASGGSPEGRIGDPLRWLIADWADATRAQRGLTIAVHFPLPYAEVAADIVTGKIEAIELQALEPGAAGPSVREWYRFLGCGYRLPVVGGTDKMSAEIPLGAIRTYARLEPGRPLSFGSWAEAVRAGRTFATSGPFVEIEVDGHAVGDVVRLGRTGGTVEVRAEASAALPIIGSLELVHDGKVVATSAGSVDTEWTTLTERIRVSRSGWLAARVTSRHRIHSAFTTAMGAHTSPIYLEVPGRPAFDAADAAAIGTIIDGSRAWVETIATVISGVERRRLSGYFDIARARLDDVVRERGGR
jgi:hypothetical protein